MIKNCIYIFCWLIGFQLWGQTEPTLKLHTPQNVSEEVETVLEKYKSVDNLTQIVQELQGVGYLEANIDTVFEAEDTMHAQLHIGPVYEWVALKQGNVDDGTLAMIGFREKIFRGKPFNPIQLRKVQESLLKHMENKGYPFAEVGLTDISLEQGKVEASLYVEPNKLFLIDSLGIVGDAKISKKYLGNYLGLRKGDVYNESLIQDIGTRIKELPFLAEYKTPKVTFIGSEVWVEMNLKKVKASKFNFLLGILPNNSANAEKAYTITGDGQMNLINTLGGGEEMELIYKSYPNNATELKTKFLYPYLPLLPLGLDAKFEIYLRDSLYRDIVSYAGLQYNMGGTNHVQIFFNSQRTSLLSINKDQIIQTKRLPDNLDVSNTFYGVAFNYEKLDYRLNPRKGWNTNISLALGNKKIIQNNAILQLEDPNDMGFNFKTLYEETPNKNVQYRATYVIDKYFGLGRASTLKMGLKGGMLRSLQADTTIAIYDNERFRIGGNRVLRGFDEESIFADWYNVVTLEYRYLISQNSSFFLFTDGSYLTNLQADLAVDQAFYAYGFGIGINFETKAGIFGMSYALGSQKGNQIQVQNGKVHFGYVNYF